MTVKAGEIVYQGVLVANPVFYILRGAEELCQTLLRFQIVSETRFFARLPMKWVTGLGTRTSDSPRWTWQRQALSSARCLAALTGLNASNNHDVTYALQDTALVLVGQPS